MLRFVEDWDFAITFTPEQAQRLMAHGIKPKKLGIIPHGLDQGKFYVVDRDEARKRLGLPLDKFIVFNGSRNQPRKLIDQTIKAFAEFAKDKDDVILYLNIGRKRPELVRQGTLQDRDAPKGCRSISKVGDHLEHQLHGCSAR